MYIVMKPLSLIEKASFNRSQVEFNIHDTEDFDFEENLDFPSNSKGVYMFADRYNQQNYTIYYVGRTKNLRRRFCHHHKREDLLYGDVFNVLCVHYCDTIEETKDLEERLIKLYKPSYNDKLNPEYQD